MLSLQYPQVCPTMSPLGPNSLTAQSDTDESDADVDGDDEKMLKMVRRASSVAL